MGRTSAPTGTKRGRPEIAPNGDAPDVRRRKYLDYYRGLATERGGSCTSREYVSAHGKLGWICAKGHAWSATANSVRMGSWCPECAKVNRPEQTKADNFVRAKAMAKLRGGRCLSKDYVDSQTHLRWRCRKGHEWEAVPSSIIQGSWCGVCAGVAPLTIEDMRATALERGGQCVSTEYVNQKTPIRWRCAEGHEWDAVPSNVRMGHWCGQCSGHAPLSLAIIQADAIERGGACLSKRYAGVGVKHRYRCRVGHVFTATPNHVRTGSWCPRCLGMGVGSIARMRSIAQRLGGECLSAEYVTSNAPLRWRCRRGHEWTAPADGIVQGSWCRICRTAEAIGKRRPLTIEEMQQLAQARGGECLSDTYLNSKTKLLWRCHAGHEWWALAPKVKHGRWCPVCARSRPGTIDGMRALAAERGGACLSSRYEGHRTELELVCAKGHRFRASGRALKTGVWCDVCERGQEGGGRRARGG